MSLFVWWWSNGWCGSFRLRREACTSEKSRPEESWALGGCMLVWGVRVAKRDSVSWWPRKSIFSYGKKPIWNCQRKPGSVDVVIQRWCERKGQASISWCRDDPERTCSTRQLDSRLFLTSLGMAYRKFQSTSIFVLNRGFLVLLGIAHRNGLVGRGEGWLVDKNSLTRELQGGTCGRNW